MKTKTGLTPLACAALQGSDKALFALIQSENDMLLQTDPQGYNALHMAAGKGQTLSVALLLKLGASVNDKTNEGFTPLHCAAQGS